MASQLTPLVKPLIWSAIKPLFLRGVRLEGDRLTSHEKSQVDLRPFSSLHLVHLVRMFRQNLFCTGAASPNGHGQIQKKINGEAARKPNRENSRNEKTRNKKRVPKMDSEMYDLERARSFCLRFQGYSDIYPRSQRSQ